MRLPEDAAGRPPLYIPCSTTVTTVNPTGSWRYFRPLYRERTSPCSAACPTGQDIARIEMLGAWGLYREAWQALLLENPFPAVCGRVCPHPCEGACNRSGFDQAVAVHALERFLGDRFLNEAGTRDDSRAGGGRRVAVVGAGPAGLAAAWFLALLGHRCTLFESRPRPGGLLRCGIPAYRLPEAVAAAEIGRITGQEGIRLCCSQFVDAAAMDRLRSEYDALVVAAGCSRPVAVGIPGEALAEDGLAFLEQVRAGGEVASPAGRVAVVGGGNTALDVARSLVRLGADPVIVYRRRRQDMPAFADEVDMAEDEGVVLRELMAPVAIEALADGGGLCLHLQRMRVSGVTDGGRARVVPEEGRVEQMHVQRVYSAVGAVGNPLFQPPLLDTAGDGLYNCRVLDDRPPVLAIGDLSARQRSVVHAVASGKEAAMALDRWLACGRDAVGPALAACRVGPGPALSMAVYLERPNALRDRHVVAFDEVNHAYFTRSQRAVCQVLAPADRRRHFNETEATLEAASAAAEFLRCFNCGRCNACDNCRLFCPEMAVVVEKGRRRIDLDFCKGCGICVEECPRSAMAMEEEGT